MNYFKMLDTQLFKCIFVHLFIWKVSVTQSCLTLCNPMDCCPPGSSVHGILQARILEWVAIPFSRGSSRPWNRTWVSCTADSFPSEPPGKQLVSWLVVFECAGSLVLREGPLWLQRAEETPYGRAPASAAAASLAAEHGLPELQLTRLAALQHVGSFRTREQTCVLCIGRRIPIH